VPKVNVTAEDSVLLWSAEHRLNGLGILKTTFDVDDKRIKPKHILKVIP
jgi:hypothetical protein